MTEKSFILVILSSLKSVSVCSKLLHVVVSLLAAPFVTPNITYSETQTLTQVFIYL